MTTARPGESDPWYGLGWTRSPRKRTPKITPFFLVFCQETVCVLTTLLCRLCVTNAELTSGMHTSFSASLAGHRLPQGVQQSSSVQPFHTPLTPSLRHVFLFHGMLKEPTEACEAKCRQWWDNITPCDLKTPEALLCLVTRVAAEEERKEVFAGRRGLWEALDRPTASRPLRGV